MSLLGTVWTPIGPSPIDEGGAEDNGLVTAIAVNPNNTNVIYIGTAGGGVWRSADGGTNWTPLFDRELSAPNLASCDPLTSGRHGTCSTTSWAPTFQISICR